MRKAVIGCRLRVIAVTLAIVIMPLLTISRPVRGNEFVGSAGLIVYYSTVGTGPPLLLLSGGPGLDVDYMKPLAERLGGTYQCILLEQRGTGRSQPQALTGETISLKLLVEDIEAMRLSLKADQLRILGHSFGGMLAMAYAAEHPDRIHSLILVSSGGVDTRFQSVFLENVIVRAPMRDRDKIQAALARAQQSEDAGPDLLHLLLPLYFFDRNAGEQFIAQGSKAGYHARTAGLLQLDLQRNYDVAGRLSGFSRPVLIIQGHQDPIPESTAIQTHAVLKHSEVIFLDRSGHFPWLEQPQAFYAHLQSFLRSDSRVDLKH